MVGFMNNTLGPTSLSRGSMAAEAGDHQWIVKPTFEFSKDTKPSLY
jgi:hypothetical protein